jgi:hypothetical protein
MLKGWSFFCFRTSVRKFYAKCLDPSSRQCGRNVSLGHALRRERDPLREWNIQSHLTADRGANGHSLATDYGLRRISATSFIGQRSDVAVAAEEYPYENIRLFGARVCWHGADAIRVGGHCACSDGKRLRWTRRLLRKPHSQWRASELLSNDSGSSRIAIWHTGSRLSQQMRHSSH